MAVVFYHGKRKWTVPVRFSDRFEELAPLFLRYIPNFEYILIDTSQYSDEMLREIKSGSLQASLFLLKYIFDDALGSQLSKVLQPLTGIPQEELLDRLMAVINYIITATDKVDENEFQAMLTDVFRDAEDTMPTIAEKWFQQGEVKGHTEGHTEGRTEGALSTIVHLLRVRFGSISDGVLNTLKRFDMDRLEQVVALGLNAKSLDEFTERLSILNGEASWSLLKPSAQKVQKSLMDLGLTNQVIELEKSTRTAAEAAEAVGCEVAQIAKSLIFQGKESGRALLIIASGANRVNEKRMKALIGEALVRPDADFVREQTGFAIGGVPPVGHTQPIPTYIDEELLQYEQIWAAAGHPNALFPLTPEELVQMTQGKVTGLT